MEHPETVSCLQNEIKRTKNIISEKNKEVQKKSLQKEELTAKNNENQIKIKECVHKLKKLEDNYNQAKAKKQEYSKGISDNNAYLRDAEVISHKEGLDLERRIKVVQEKKNKLSRCVNTKAQSMFEHEEKQVSYLIDYYHVIYIKQCNF
ncbi:hypothetical protein NQ315_003567 [Exocentrus adspersus]|uniref:Uncharacterized protein n=1 Tax=Exocentrus adspersus TaxID=1586481 RepID=A0AAV8V5X1_9CUCU|nr:hypothetical protein NQ315_003567 [Exocentrus adspersus]